MEPIKKLDRQGKQRVKEQRRTAKREKLEKQKQNFWKSFLIHENGKPKSALLIYTFCLSFLFLAFYIVSFGVLIDVLQPLVLYLPVFIGNLLTSSICSIAAVLPACLFHHFLKDKRLVFGGYLWVGVYVVAIFVTELVILREDQEAVNQFLLFYTWFFLLPVLIGLAGTFLLYKKDSVI